MLRLIYTSTAPRFPSEKALQDILAVSRKNNARDGITGLLVYHEGCYLQILEGPEDKVTAAFARIRRDPRHTSTLKMVSEPVSARIFDTWRMAYWSYADLPGLQKRQFQDIRALADAASDGEALSGSPAANAILMAFLSSFRDLDLAI